jgi:hypothetical protein
VIHDAVFPRVIGMEMRSTSWTSDMMSIYIPDDGESDAIENELLHATHHKAWNASCGMCGVAVNEEPLMVNEMGITFAV